MLVAVMQPVQYRPNLAQARCPLRICLASGDGRRLACVAVESPLAVVRAQQCCHAHTATVAGEDVQMVLHGGFRLDGRSKRAVHDSRPIFKLPSWPVVTPTKAVDDNLRFTVRVLAARFNIRCFVSIPWALECANRADERSHGEVVLLPRPVDDNLGLAVRELASTARFLVVILLRIDLAAFSRWSGRILDDASLARRLPVIALGYSRRRFRPVSGVLGRGASAVLFKCSRYSGRSLCATAGVLRRLHVVVAARCVRSVSWRDPSHRSLSLSSLCHGGSTMTAIS